jgi:hypothetical protein
VGKLAGTMAERRLLLLECAAPYPHRDIADAIGKLAREFTGLGQVEAVWIPDTLAGETEGSILFETVFPDSLWRFSRVTVSGNVAGP